MSILPDISNEQSTDAGMEDEAEAEILCKNCSAYVSSRSFAIEPHEHTFRNPAGYSFHVLCFSQAPGAAEVSGTTTEHSWFEGYAWAFALCKSCGNHLGWWYSGKDRFAGLIATRLIR